MISGHPNAERTRASPAAPSRAASAGSRASRCSASANRRGSAGGTSNPVLPSVMMSVMPPMSLPITGTP
jgi:hypothetical protein